MRYKSAAITKNRKLAFGVEPSTRRYRLRLARYQAMAEDIAAFAKEQRLKKGQKLNLLDVGLESGRSMMFIDATGFNDIVFYGIDKSVKKIGSVFSPQRWTLKHCDVEASGIPFDASMFDIVICKQVLEHLANPQFVLWEICRVLRPGGLLIVGTTIYWPGLTLFRRYVTPLFDGLAEMSRSHKQVFSYQSFIKLINDVRSFSIRKISGLRFVSGGLFGPLEDFYWWYSLNRFLGRAIPRLCPEIQVVAVRSPSTEPHDMTGVSK